MRPGKRQGLAQKAAGFAVALAANGVGLAFLVINVVTRPSTPPLEPKPPLTVELIPMRAEARASARARPPAEAPIATALRAAADRPSSTRRPAPPDGAPLPMGLPTPSATTVGGAETAAAAPPAKDDAGATGVAAVLRHIQACSAWGSAERERAAHCDTRSATAQTTSGVSPEKRAAFDAADRRADDLMDHAAAMQRDTHEPFAGASAVRVGCAYKGGQWRCGTY